MTERNHFVYRCYDADDRCVYVGCTKNLKRRMSEHRTQRTGASLAVRIKVSGPYTRAVALELEKQFMESEDPLWGLTPKRQLAVASGQLDMMSIYPPRSMPTTSAASSDNSKRERSAA